MTSTPPPAIESTAPKGSPAAAIVAILLVVLGGIAVPFGLIASIAAALTPGGAGPGGYIAVLVAGVIAIVVGVIIGLVGLIRGPRRGLSAVPVVIALAPIIAVIVLVNAPYSGH